jgi:hypothetical protein
MISLALLALVSLVAHVSGGRETRTVREGRGFDNFSFSTRRVLIIGQGDREALDDRTINRPGRPTQRCDSRFVSRLCGLN